MKKVWILILIVLLMTACKPQTTSEYNFEAEDPSFSYFPKTTMNEDKHLYVFGYENDRKLNMHELTTGQAIQGLFARDEVTFYLNTQSTGEAYWLQDMVDHDGITYELIGLSQMIEMYKNKFEDVGYLLYDQNETESINVATSLAGILGYLPIEKTLESIAISAGLEMKMDVSEKSEKWAFDTYKDEFNWNSVIQLRQDIPHLRDYGVTFKYFYFYQDEVSSAAINFRDEIHRAVAMDSPIFGWGPFAEDSHIGIASRNGQFTLPSDYSYNTTVYSARDFFNIEDLDMQIEEEAIVPQNDKHYVTIVRSDGDNLQTWYNYFPFSDKDLGATRSDFSMGWSIQPSLVDIAPNILRDIYTNRDENDYYVASVSGQGYMYPSLYPDLKDFVQRLDVYLQKTDLDIVQILDSGPDEDVVQWYSQMPSLKGAIYMYGEKYKGGDGSVIWSENGKPFVSIRESLWDSTSASIADRINQYDTDYTSINGYTIINLHPWSQSYQDVSELVSLFDDHVEVISPSQLFDLIIENVDRDEN
ncbi:hypothetical protein KHQ89_05935 [Mycoplasmatota bacterium]|nr:hypothetical protein KHQ89_05935 [Mycoplasmatota bacterium]